MEDALTFIAQRNGALELRDPQAGAHVAKDALEISDTILLHGVGPFTKMLSLAIGEGRSPPVANFEVRLDGLALAARSFEGEVPDLMNSEVEPEIRDFMDAACTHINAGLRSGFSAHLVDVPLHVLVPQLAMSLPGTLAPAAVDAAATAAKKRAWRRRDAAWVASCLQAYRDLAESNKTARRLLCEQTDVEGFESTLQRMISELSRPADMVWGIHFQPDMKRLNLSAVIPACCRQALPFFTTSTSEWLLIRDSKRATKATEAFKGIAASQLLVAAACAQAVFRDSGLSLHAQALTKWENPTEIATLRVDPDGWGLDLPALAAGWRPEEGSARIGGAALSI